MFFQYQQLALFFFLVRNLNVSLRLLVISLSLHHHFIIMLARIGAIVMCYPGQRQDHLLLCDGSFCLSSSSGLVLCVILCLVLHIVVDNATLLVARPVSCAHHICFLGWLIQRARSPPHSPAARVEGICRRSSSRWRHIVGGELVASGTHPHGALRCTVELGCRGGPVPWYWIHASGTAVRFITRRSQESTTMAMSHRGHFPSHWPAEKIFG